MPLYEYECDQNGHRFEVIQKFSDPPITTCPTCGSSVRKLLSSPAIQFKGTGWYVTDYARKGDAGAKDGKDAKSAKGAKEGESKDSKETKAESPAKADTSSTSSGASPTPASKD